MKKSKVRKILGIEILPYKILHCPLFLHQKHTHACIALRAKKVCRVNCPGFFEWVKDNEETVQAVVKKHEAPIKSYLARHELPNGPEDIIGNIMPKGEHICEFCGKAFKVEGRLKTHREKKHRRQIFKESLPRRNSRGVGQHREGGGH